PKRRRPKCQHARHSRLLSFRAQSRNLFKLSPAEGRVRPVGWASAHRSYVPIRNCCAHPSYDWGDKNPRRNPSLHHRLAVAETATHHNVTLTATPAPSVVLNEVKDLAFAVSSD
ncbi:MAG: hypothetical protein ACYTFW_21230, partial [Planctomycetota bacterium]